MWKVYFNGSFGEPSGRKKAGKETLLNKEFVWDEERWFIPAIYTCAQGYVVDFCMQVPAERIRAFLDKWELSPENDGRDFSEEDQMQAQAEQPLNVNLRPQLVLNGTVLSYSHGCGIYWNPCFPEDNDPMSEEVLRHYGLDPAYGWAIWRSSFPWKKRGKPEIKILAAEMVAESVAISGQHFCVSGPGEIIQFVHPVTGQAHKLTVHTYEQRQLPQDFIEDENYIFPRNLTVMGYTTSPHLPDDTFNVFDCHSSDAPRPKFADPGKLGVMGMPAVSIGIIGSADGPTAISLSEEDRCNYRTACSALHFEPIEKVEWRLMFYEKKREDITVELI